MRSLLRHAFIASIAALAAAATVGGTVFAHNNGFNERIVACFESRDPNSDECIAALEVSPVDADFFAQLGANLTNLPPREPEPKPEPKRDLYSAVKACAESGDLGSDACWRVMDEYGLTSEELEAKVLAKFGCVFSDADAANVCGKRATGKSTSAAMRECLAVKASLNGRDPSELVGLVEKLNVVCRKAMLEAKLTPAQFWTKYR